MRERLAPFRGRYLGILGLVLVYGLLFVVAVQGAKILLNRHFDEQIDRVVAESAQKPTGEPSMAAIQIRVHRVVTQSPWVRWGGVDVEWKLPSALGPRPGEVRILGRWVSARLPLISPLMFSIGAIYLILLTQTLFFFERRRARRDEAQLRFALREREETAHRAEQIETELASVRRRLAERAEEELPADEFRALQEERARLREKLDALAQREAELRTRAGRAESLESERDALEELLDEALRDMAHKDEEIQSLETRLRRAAKSESTPRRRREEDLFARRLRTLYKNVELDERAIHDLVALRDEGMKLRAEESLKRLADDSEGATVRRKVAGLPARLNVFELGFGAKGRIYYTRGRQRAYRILAVGAKNTQNTDLEYLSRLPKES